MSGEKRDEPYSSKEMEPGYCSAYCVDKASLLKQIKEPPRTSEVFTTCNLPKRFDNPHWFNGYGSQADKQHPLYRTTSNEYGWYPPGLHTIPSGFYPKNGIFTSHLAKSGMYRNYSLNTGLDH